MLLNMRMMMMMMMMMMRFFNIVNVVAALVVVGVLLSLQRVEATNYTVAEAAGWRIHPNGAASTYSDWASNISFQIGDVLVFDFVTGLHDVAVVTQQDYDACSTAAPVDLYSTGPTAFSLDVLGNYYFICTKGSGASHCLSGQKLAITVLSSPLAPSPSSSPPTRASVTPPPPPPKDNKGSPSLASNLSMILFISMTMSFLLTVLGRRN